jgi:hypothetical protein
MALLKSSKGLEDAVRSRRDVPAVSRRRVIVLHLNRPAR